MDVRYVLALAVIAVSAIAIGAVMMGGSPDGQSDDIMDSVQFDESGSMKVKAGQQFTVSFRGNATTGYDWIVASDGGLKVVNDWYQADDAGNPPRVGVGGVHHFTLIAEKAGTYEATFDYQRSWEGSEGNTRTITVTAE